MVFYQIFLFINNYRITLYTAVKTLYLKIFPFGVCYYLYYSLVFLKILCQLVFSRIRFFTILYIHLLYFLILYR